MNEMTMLSVLLQLSLLFVDARSAHLTGRPAVLLWMPPSHNLLVV